MDHLKSDFVWRWGSSISTSALESGFTSPEAFTEPEVKFVHGTGTQYNRITLFGEKTVTKVIRNVS